MSAAKEIHPWQEALSDVITQPKELLNILQLDPALLEAAEKAARLFPLRVPRGFVARMQKGNKEDPLLKQVLPLGIELTDYPGYEVDPLKENAVNPIPGLLHKYQGRVLVMLTGACAVHCRYCFRRHFPYEKNNPGRSGWAAIFDYIRAETSINEVILSGGDPLVVNDKTLISFTDELSNISHVKRLRIHTRLPIVLPERITKNLLTWFSSLSLQPVVIIHANHPQEINEEVKTVLLRLRENNVTLLNQAVLLKGVNDTKETLIALSETLFKAGVLPYYLHTLDKVQGAAHFDVTLEKARELYSQLLSALPGYLVPKLVCEEAEALSKTLLFSN